MEQNQYQEQENELIKLILGEVHRNDCQSTLQLAINSTLNQDFVQLLLHLISLEQIGNLFCKKGSDGNGIVKAIQTSYPNRFSEDQLQGFKHLRHALVHNFGLAIIDKNQDNKDKNKYKYILYREPNEEIIIAPKHNWDGILKFTDLQFSKHCKADKETSYLVYIPSLISMAKEIIAQIFPKKLQEGKLHFVHEKGNQNITDEELGQIAYKYFVYYL